jgi:hypothetical protein
MADRPDLRASDADRERTADLLRRSAGDGRLDPDELEERLTSAYGARTTGELADLTRDLPSAPPRPVPRREATLQLRRRYGGLLFPPLVCTLIWLATGAHGSFWPIWVWLGCGIAALAGILGVDDRHRRRERRRDVGSPPEPPGD